MGGSSGGGGGGRGKGGGRRKKQGKERLDRYYHLAKEQGYRARSAFKLIQLAQRFSLFQRPRHHGVSAAAAANAAIVDLCAAPGGWLQVCVKHAPVATRIIGVDLVPIKSIRGVDTLTEDITRPSLPSKIKKLLPRGVDVWLVLHDGSPNMGTDWSIDAFNQNVLVLSALRVAALLLCEGGTFVSKVFRSQDYAALLFVLQTLFTRVHATKPLASRNVSAEIFVVCQGYKKPAVLDPRLFEPKCVFLQSAQNEADDNTDSLLNVHKQLVPKPLTSGRGVGGGEGDGGSSSSSSSSSSKADKEEDDEEECENDDGEGEDGVSYSSSSGLGLDVGSGGGIFGKGKKGLFAELVRQQAKRHRHGEQLSGLRRVTIEEFFKSEEPASLLVLQTAELIFQTPLTPLEKAVKQHTLTTGEILRCIADIQVLGKGELASLLKWRFRVKRNLSILQRKALTQEQQNEQQMKKSRQEKDGGGAAAAAARGSMKGDKQQQQEDATSEDDASTEEGTPSDDGDDAQKDEEKEDLEGELQRVGSLVQRREEKRRKRLELKKKQREMRLRLSRGTGLDDGSDSTGHHIDPDLFAFSSTTASLLEEEKINAAVDKDDLFQSDDETSSHRHKKSRETRNLWIEEEDEEEEDEEEEDDGVRIKRSDDEEKDSSDADTTTEGEQEEGRLDDADRIACMERELMLGHRAQKLKRAQAKMSGAVDAKMKKKTRRERVRSEWAAELESFRDSIQAEAAAVLAEKARKQAESDESEEDEDEGEEEEGEETNIMRNSKGKAISEVLDDDDDTVCCSTESQLASEDGSSTREGVATWGGAETAEKIKERKTRGNAVIKDSRSTSNWIEAEKTARWFRQPLFEGCEEKDTLLPAALQKLRHPGATAAATTAAAVCAYGMNKEVVSRSEKKRKRSSEGSEYSDDGNDSDDMSAEYTYESTAGRDLQQQQQQEEEEEEEESSIVELDDAALPVIPACEKRQKQQRRREQLQKELKRMKKMKCAIGDDFDDDVLQEEPSTTPRGSRKSGNQRLEEVQPFDAVSGGGSAIKAPRDPEELAEIQTLGNCLINRTSRMDLIDDAYNRYAFNDDELPEWFVEEEKKHNKPQLPLTKELMRQYRQKLLDISRRPIRKVQEARARKQQREKRRLQKVKSQATAIAESAEFTEAGKARAIEKIARKASRVKERTSKNYFVVSRGVRGGKTLVSKNKGGTKGAKTKFVDRRMKKDRRAQKKAGNRKGSKGSKKRSGRHSSRKSGTNNAGSRRGHVKS